MRKITTTPPATLSFRFPPQLRGIKGGASAFTLVELIVVITILAIL
jgi:prepilin-type N-terminal cleavage/methylation domain-containing protein